MEFLSQLPSNNIVMSELTIRLLVILSVILLERWVVINGSYHPGTLWRFLALKLSLKTRKRSAKQQHLSGSLSTLMLLFCAVVIGYAILSLAIYPWFFSALFLLLAINSSAILISCKHIYQSLNGDKKNLAREQLRSLCIRDTHTLSTMGISKACIEGAIQQYSKKYFIPILIYLIFGPMALITYALLNSLAQYWNPKQQRYRFFGQFPQHIINVITLPFHCLLSLNIAALYGFKHVSLKRNNWHKFGAGALLTTTANTMNRELGGAVMYDNIKIKRPKLGPSHHPDNDDIKHAYRLIKKLRQSTLLIILLCLAFSLFTP